jgi:hypothetical protein
LFVVGPVEEVVVVVCLLSLALLQAEVWLVLVVVVVVWVKPAFPLGGFVTSDVVVLVVVPQSLVLAAWAAGENENPPTAAEVKANPTSSVFSMLRSYSVLG